MSRHPLAIVLGIDTPIGLTVMRELGRAGVPVHGIGRSAKALGAASKYCTGFSVRPKGMPLADWLPRSISATGAKALLAISEGDLLELADLPDRIGDCRILTPRADPLALALDKERTLALARQVGILVPKSWLPRMGDDFPRQVADLTFPVVVKWPNPPEVMDRLTAADIEWVKAEFAHDEGALLAILGRYRPLGIWPLVQEYCAGEGFGQMLHMDGGQATLAFQHRRLHEWPPEGGVSTLCRAEPMALHTAQLEKSVALLRAMDWQGPAMVEYRHDQDTGRYWLMEVNGRFWGSLPLAMHSGAHFGWETYARAMLAAPAAQHGTAGRKARYMVPETRRLLRILFDRRAIRDPMFRVTPLRDIAAYILGFFDPRDRYYVFSLDDPGPFVADLRAMIRKVVRRGKR